MRRVRLNLQKSSFFLNFRTPKKKKKQAVPFDAIFFFLWVSLKKQVNHDHIMSLSLDSMLNWAWTRGLKITTLCSSDQAIRTHLIILLIETKNYESKYLYFWLICKITNKNLIYVLFLNTIKPLNLPYNDCNFGNLYILFIYSKLYFYSWVYFSLCCRLAR